MDKEYEALISAKEYLDKLIPGIEKINESFRSGDLSMIHDFVDGMHGIAWLIEVFQLTKDSYNINYDAESINEHFDAINEAFENEDWTLVADIAQYELSPILENWHTALEGIIQ